MSDTYLYENFFAILNKSHCKFSLQTFVSQVDRCIVEKHAELDGFVERVFVAVKAMPLHDAESFDPLRSRSFAVDIYISCVEKAQHSSINQKQNSFNQQQAIKITNISIM